jgi:Protein of unknown function (DUF4031)
MTIYVDNVRIPATVDRIRGRWSHLMTDGADTEELHQFAEKLGLRRSWFQPGDRPWLDHYDVTEGKRREAIEKGAKSVDLWDAHEVIDRRRAAIEAAGR